MFVGHGSYVIVYLRRGFSRWGQESELKNLLEFNKRLAESDERLPPFDSGMTFACLTKNHLASALKLFRGGKTPLVGNEEVIIAPPEHDSALRTHLSRGVFCEVRSDMFTRAAQDARTSVCMSSVRTWAHL